MVESILNKINREKGAIYIFLCLSEFLSATGWSSFCNQNTLPDDLTLNPLDAISIVDLKIDISRIKSIYIYVQD